MAIKKRKLRKLDKELTRTNIRSKSINSASEYFSLTKAFIRLVLSGVREDNHGIIEYLTDCVIQEKHRLENVSNKIDTL